MNNLNNLLIIMRPWQWLKNLIIFTIYVGSGETSFDPFLNLTIAYMGLCLISSAGYIYNDIKDKPLDATHPEKKFRPIASGKVGIETSKLFMFFLLLISLVVFSLINPKALAIAITYFVISMLYTNKIKYVKHFDSLFISLLFLIRIFAGSAATGISISIYLFIFVFASSYMLSLSKKISILNNSLNQTDYKNYLIKTYKINNLIFLYKLFSNLSIFTFGLWGLDKLTLETLRITDIASLIIAMVSMYFIFLNIYKKTLSGILEDIAKEFYKTKEISFNLIIFVLTTLNITY